MTFVRTIAAGLALLLAASPGYADVIVIDGVTLIDGRGGPAEPNMTVVIKDGKFSQIGRDKTVGASDAVHVDGRGRFLIPGLMDMHVHLRGGIELSREGLRKAAINRDEGVAALHSYLYSGVTSIFDAGNNPEFIFELRDAERSGRLLAPRIFATGGIATYPGSHGSGPGSTDLRAWPEAQAALDAHLARKPDLLKLTLEERGWGNRPMIPMLDPDVMRKVVEYTNDRGIRTVVHVSSELRARQAIFAGVDALAHPVIQGPVSEEFLKLMGAKRIPMVTTLTIGDNYSRLVEHPEYLDQPLYRASLSKQEIAMLQTERRAQWQDNRWTWWMKLMTPVAQDNVRKLYASGAILVVGTDQTSGPAVHRELELLQSAGIPAAAIIRMATLNGAILLGKESDLGSIEAGKMADAVLLDADPTSDINNTKRIALVIKNGKVVKESQLRLAGGPVVDRKIN
ncbi:MAG: amidohydrolase family protein [Steroidobacteraceae bacterium]